MAHVTRGADAAFAVTTAALFTFTWSDFLTGKVKMVGGGWCMPCVTSWGEKEVEDEAVQRLEGRGFGLILGSFRS